MKFEGNNIINLEERRLAPLIEAVLASIIPSKGVMIDPELTKGFGNDHTWIIAINHEFTRNADGELTISFTTTDNEGGSDSISNGLAETIARRLQEKFAAEEMRYQATSIIGPDKRSLGIRLVRV